MPIIVTTNRELRQRRWLKRIERLVPQMIEKADKEGRDSRISTRQEMALRRLNSDVYARG